VKVFLTGGTGLLGSHVAQRLRDHDHEVVVLSRANSDVSFLRSLECTLVTGELEDPPECHAERMEGCQGLVHAAAHIYGGRSLEAVRAVNVVGTSNLLEGATLAGLRQVVHISSVAAYGDPPFPIDEKVSLDAPLRKIDYYGRTKREGELLARGFHREDGLGVTVLRPPAIYGERDRLFVPKLEGFLRRRLVFVLGTGRARLAAVYAGNVAQAVELALEGQGSGEVFNVSEDVPVTQLDLYGGLARELGLKVVFISIPGTLASFGAKVGDAIGIRIPGARDLSLSRAVRLSVEDNPYPSTKAHEMLGWKPPYSLEEALSRTGQWIRERNAIYG
jgi:nucleoside-diphosphate-sugar epimerase